jgi:hypothetical protein
MNKPVDPKKYGLPKGTALNKTGLNSFTLEINRKSRIIMKDALTIIKKIGKVKAKEPKATFVLRTNAPVCSKSLNFLKENGITVENISD